MIFSKFYSSALKLHLSHSIILIRTFQVSNSRPLIMPKDNKYLIELQKQRRRIKAAATKFSPSHINLQVIGNGCNSEPRALLLVTDHTNYLFNCGEGTQRLASEHHAKLTKIEHIFVTKPTWKNMGGIPGVQLTIQDTGVPRVVLHGPDGTIDLVEATKNFITLNQLEVLPADLSNPFSDHTMTVNYVSLENPEKSEPEEPILADFQSDNINFYDYRVNANNKRPRSPNLPNKGNLRAKCQKRIKNMMGYVCRIHPRVGALDFSKCVDLGVPAGPLLGKLKSGQDITLPNGTLVKSQDVVAPSEPGPLFIVLECPDEDWINVIVENPVFSKHQKNAVSDDQVADYVIHFTPERVINNSKYKEWMSKFGTQTKHLILNEKNDGHTSEAVHKMQYQLNLIHPTIFPLLKGAEPVENNLDKTFPLFKENEPVMNENSENQQKNNNINENNKNIEEPQENDNIHYCQTLNEVHLRPHDGLDPVNVQLKPLEYLEEAYKVPDFSEEIEKLRKAINGQTKTLDSFEEYPKLLMLGTGSSIPNKVRNTSGMLLQIDDESSIIMDCGEGTLGQMFRFFGDAEMKNVLKNIKAIFVSHLHADHHLGLIGILKEREKVTEEPVFLLAPQQIVSYLYFYHNRFEPIAKCFRLINNRELLLNQVILASATEKELKESLHVSNVSTSFVRHCPFAYGLAITLKDGRKICYSGDCIPCDSFLKLARDSYLMIHEATMEDNLESEAKMKFHSTISQAINVGVKAEAKFTLLTHFSQRYSKIPMLPFKTEGGPDFTKVGIAYDFMIISLSQLPLLHLFYSSLNLMFSEFRSLLDERSYKRELRKEQIANESRRKEQAANSAH